MGALEGDGGCAIILDEANIRLTLLSYPYFATPRAARPLGGLQRARLPLRDGSPEVCASARSVERSVRSGCEPAARACRDRAAPAGARDGRLVGGSFCRTTLATLTATAGVSRDRADRASTADAEPVRWSGCRARGRRPLARTPIARRSSSTAPGPTPTPSAARGVESRRSRSRKCWSPRRSPLPADVSDRRPHTGSTSTARCAAVLMGAPTKTAPGTTRHRLGRLRACLPGAARRCRRSRGPVVRAYAGVRDLTPIPWNPRRSAARPASTSPAGSPARFMHAPAIGLLMTELILDVARAEHGHRRALAGALRAGLSRAKHAFERGSAGPECLGVRDRRRSTTRRRAGNS